MLLLVEALFTLPALRVFLTPPGCRPGVLGVLLVLCALAPLLMGLRTLTKKQRWWWVAGLIGPLAWVIPVGQACVPPL